MISHKLTFKRDSRIAQLLPAVIIGGGLMGTMVWRLSYFDSRWIIFAILGMALPFAALITKDTRTFLMLLLVFSIPINADINFFYREHHAGAAGISISLFDIILFSLYGIWFVESVIHRRFKIRVHPATTIPAFMLIIVSLASVINAPSVELGIFEVIRMIKVFLAYLYLANHIRSVKEVKLVVIPLIAGLVLQSILAFMQYYLGVTFGLSILGEATALGSLDLEYLPDTHRVGGTIGNPNDFAKYLIFLLPLVLAMLCTRMKKVYRIMLFGIFLAGTGALVTTFSRGGMLSMFFACILTLILIFREQLLTRNAILKTTVTILLVCAVLFSFGNILISRFITDNNASASVRIPLMKVAWSIIRDHPFLGIGINNYPFVTTIYGDPMIPFTITSRVHNVYLLIAAETGLIGLLVFIWLLIAIFRNGVLPGEGKNQYLACVSTGIMGGMFANLLHFMVDPYYIGGYTLFWTLAGVLVAIQHLRELSDTDDGGRLPADDNMRAV